MRFSESKYLNQNQKFIFLDRDGTINVEKKDYVKSYDEFIFLDGAIEGLKLLNDNKYNIIGDTDTLDLDPRSFSQRIDAIELEQIDQKPLKKKSKKREKLENCEKKTKELNLKYNMNDLVKGDVIFCATGVTDGNLVKGIKDVRDYFEAETFVLHKSSNTNKIIKNKIKK